MPLRGAARSVEPATVAYPRTRDFRSRAVVASLFLALMTSASAYACGADFKEYYGRCVAATPAPAKVLTFLKDYGQQASKVGEFADLFAPDIPLFDKPEPGRKIIYSWKQPNSDIESEVKIEKVLPEFYYVAVSVYEGPTSCGIEEFKLKGPKTTLRGYVPKANRKVYRRSGSSGT
ncbi:hypothetical protein JQ596_28750 [Bradyrhizobium manausense]|uniref:hypothetical protein n=1 Tax=Bradyrhizobium manausense TaxID=989370 RepID=UPI001BAB98FD|nr:hypothetical protein [Bradyrhizobium manausense]MBR0829531.1 hypothetical protein [Bradyrhizobium manausense]